MTCIINIMNFLHSNNYVYSWPRRYMILPTKVFLMSPINKNPDPTIDINQLWKTEKQIRTQSDLQFHNIFCWKTNELCHMLITISNRYFKPLIQSTHILSTPFSRDPEFTVKRPKLSERGSVITRPDSRPIMKIDLLPGGLNNLLIILSISSER